MPAKRVICAYCRKSIHGSEYDRCKTCRGFASIAPGPDDALTGGRWVLNPATRILDWIKDAA